uniref:furin n=1 Tax=Oryctolagus cuniculus TaxID=9986 RepID=A0A5F9C7N2_RABIT
MELRPWLLWVLATAGALVLLAANACSQRVFTNTWAVRIPGGLAVADGVARKHGFLNLGQIFGDYYHFWHRAVTKRSLSPHRLRHSRLQREPQVQWLEQQVAKRRSKRDVYQEPTDPKFPQQWYLSGVTQRDLNVKEAWAQGYTGHGIVVSILDDGIEKNHPDLAGNYDPGASFDVNDQDPDPQPRYTQMNDNRHGTRCAGEVAAVANNGVCGVGVAYNARIGGVRMLDGEVTDAVEARSLGLNPNHIHIYSASWGPEDDGKTVDGPARLAEEAFFRGVSQGRGGLGSIFVWASGNGGREHDSCNCDGYTNSIYTLSISSATQLGNVPWYSEACSSTLATTYSSGNQNEKQIVTTDLRQKCTESHTGTSASAPLAAGIIALTLEANKNLTWRDMQHLVVQTSKPAHLNANDWTTNGVGRKGGRVARGAGLGGWGACASQLTLTPRLHSEPLLWLRATGCRCHGGLGSELDDSGPPAEMHHRHPHGAQVRAGPGPGWGRGRRGPCWARLTVPVLSAQGHWEAAGGAQDGDGVPGRAQPHHPAGACSGTAHPVLQPPRRPGHPPGQPHGHPFHPAGRQVLAPSGPCPWGTVGTGGGAVVSWGTVHPRDASHVPPLCRPHDYSADGFNDWAFMTTHSWDEDPSGEWVLEIENTSEANNYGTGVALGAGAR